MRKHLCLCLVLALSIGAVSAQTQKGQDKVTLVSAKSAQLIEKDGQSFRKVVGPARFLHNDTYLLCDTALWNVNTNIIDAIGHVRIIQNRTQLSSQTLQYVVDEDLAKFRGSLVQLEDKDKNTLRTRYLDYNTKDSVAVFQNGAAMRDKDGQIIESQFGTYDSKASLFVFNDQVNMFTDSIFIKTSRLEYRSDLNTAYFGFRTDMWESDNMLSADDGWYDRNQELFFFRKSVHLMTKDQEAWSDSLWYHRVPNDVEMRGKVELMDTTRNVFALAGRFEYTDSLSKVKMTREAAVLSISEENERKDTLVLGADTLIFRNIPRWQVDSTWVVDAEKRLKDISGDPVMEYRRKAAEEARKKAEEARQNDPNRPPDVKGKKGKDADAAPPADNPEEPQKPEEPEKPEPPEEDLPPADSLGTRPPADSLALPPVDTLADNILPPADSLAAPPTEPPAPPEEDVEQAPGDSLTPPEEDPTQPADTLAAPPAPKDTTKIGFVWGVSHVKLYRDDMQMSCESLHYSDLDSLVRLYREPIFYNEGNRQYAADSIYVVIRNRRAERGNLLSNAFITIQEDSLSYDQIRGTEMIAYFDSTAALTRFDALGGASALFFLVENNALATVNKVESKMLYATFKDSEMEKIYYFEEPKNDGYPVVQMLKEDKVLKGFRWEPERRPRSRYDITSLEPRKSQRMSYLARPHAEFKETNRYFPGYINRIYKEIAYRDSMEVVRRKEAGLPPEPVDTSFTLPPDDSLSHILDTLVKDLPPMDSLPVTVPPVDSTAVSTPADSLTTPAVLTPEEQKALEKKQKAEERERQRAERIARQEAKWAEEDRRYEEKQAAKAQKKLNKERARKLKQLRRLEKKERTEKAIYEKYLIIERKKAEKKARKDALKELTQQLKQGIE